MITKKYYKLIRVSHEDSGYFRITNISNEVGEFSIDKYSSGTIEYSLDGVNWTSYDLTTKPSVNVNPNSNIYLRGTNFKNNQSGGSVINFTKDYTVGGNFMSLNNYATMGSVTTIDTNNYIQFAFFSQANLVSASDLNFGNVTGLGFQGLQYTFYGCTSLTTGPDLSNITTIGQSGLSDFFHNCNSLTTPPDLSSITTIDLYGLNNIFYGCTSLTTPPDLSNVTSIGQNGLASAFYGCTSLTTGPDLSNVTSIGSSGLSSTFNSCTSLTTPPDLSNVTSIGSSGLASTFSNCISLTTGPDLSNATSIGEYGLSATFQYCYKISTVTTPNIQDLTQNNILNNWLNSAGGQATGTKTVNVPAGATITTGSNSGIPTGWTRVDY